MKPKPPQIIAERPALEFGNIFLIYIKRARRCSADFLIYSWRLVETTARGGSGSGGNKL
jgi:hypothetical protein